MSAGLANGRLGEAELMDLLRGVSRSFVLTIRALPGGLRRPVGVAYLLARASDTIADTATAPIELRRECLAAFGVEMLGSGSGLFEKVRGIQPEKVEERQLLANLERVMAVAKESAPGDRAEIVELLGKITRGQEMDLMRFPDPGQVRALATAEELDEYTYLVAGCVGEFWTRICSAHLPRYGRLPLPELCTLGRGFGMGLQLVNILRDVPEDLRNGRCYLPADELRAAGVGDVESLRQDTRVMSLAVPVFEAWRQKALLRHEEARRYIEAIRPLRIRFACIIPWALGVRTLKLIGEKSPLEQPERVKVGRKEVSRIMRRAVWGAVSNSGVRSLAAG
jgi:farnesyl-diphosphate farnesyltransferase